MQPPAEVSIGLNVQAYVMGTANISPLIMCNYIYDFNWLMLNLELKLSNARKYGPSMCFFLLFSLL